MAGKGTKLDDSKVNKPIYTEAGLKKYQAEKAKASGAGKGTNTAGRKGKR